MKKADKTFIPIWEKNLEKGKLKYILKVGISWGIFMFLFMSITNYAMETNVQPMTFGKYLFGFFFWQLGGIIYGLMLWYIQNKRYHKLINS